MSELEMEGSSKTKSCKGGEDQQCLQAANFRMLQKFSQPEKFSGNFCPPWNNTGLKIMRS